MSTSYSNVFDMQILFLSARIKSNKTKAPLPFC